VHHAYLPVHVDSTGHARPLGNKPTPHSFHVPVQSYVAGVVPESEWEEFELDTPAKVVSQNGFGACNGFAAATSLEIARWVAGMPHIDLSPWFVYAILCNGYDRGSNIGEALTLLTKQGTPPNADVPYGTINPNRLSKESHEAAKRFKIEIGAPLQTWEELCSATQRREPFNFSLRVGRNFDRLSKEGVCGVDPGAGNHAITGGLGMKRLANGEWAIKWQNSWDKTWGQDGFAWVVKAHWETQQYREAYSVRAVTLDTADNNQPPPVRA
jgi:hypothetical protein